MIAEDGPLATHDFEGVQIGLSWTADGGQGLLFTCDAYEAGFNVAKYCNSTYDRLEEQQLRELDPGARRDILIEQTNIVNDDLPIAVFRFAEGRTGYNERLHNFYPNDYNLLWSLPFVWVDEP